MTQFLAKPPLPNAVQIEIIGACNLRCHMCLVRYRPPINRVKGQLAYERYVELINSMPALERVTLQGLGEPTLHPDLVRMVGYAAERGVRVGFNSNATLLTVDLCERLIEAGLGWLHVSLDGSTAEVYERIRDGASFDRVCRNIGRLMATKRRLAASNPEVRLVFVAMRANVDELPGVVRLAASWGVPEVRVQNLSHTFDDTDPAGDYEDIRRFAAEQALWDHDDRASAAAAFAEARSQAAALNVDLRLPPLGLDDAEQRRTAGSPGCTWPWDSAYVAYDGTVQPCCMVMGSDRIALGQLSESTFPEVWNSRGYQAFRTALLSDDPPDVCRGCSWYRGLF